MPSYDLATRAQALTLKMLNFSNDDITSITGMSKQTVWRYMDRAIERGLDLKARPIQILNHHVEDDPKPGRPRKKRPENKDAVVTKVRTDRFGREKSCANIADELGLSEREVGAEEEEEVVEVEAEEEEVVVEAEV